MADERLSSSRAAIASTASWERGASVARVDRAGRLLIVAEVIDPHEPTDSAARRAADVFARGLGLLAGEDRAVDAVREALAKANAAVFDPVRSRSIFAVAGAVSLAAIAWIGPGAVIASIGGCRCYRARAGQLSCVSRGHSATEPHAAAGLQGGLGRLTMQPGELVTEALGVREEALPEVELHEVFPGDRLLLCTSAVWASVAPAAILTAMAEAEADATARALACLVAEAAHGSAVAVVRAGVPGTGEVRDG